jgi:molybdopterin synthase sulfur carrier subunit
MTVLLFGITKDIVGSGSLSLAANQSESIQTVAELRSFLKGKFPELGGLSSLAVAVNSTYAPDETKITETDEIALIPPVSGG